MLAKCLVSMLMVGACNIESTEVHQVLTSARSDAAHHTLSFGFVVNPSFLPLVREPVTREPLTRERGTHDTRN